MTAGPAFALVEEPFLTQLTSMGWKVVTGSVDHPSFTGRESFREVLIHLDRLPSTRRSGSRVRWSLAPTGPRPGDIFVSVFSRGLPPCPGSLPTD